MKTIMEYPFRNKKLKLLLALMITILFTSCSKDNTEAVYNHLDLRRMASFIGKPVEDFENHYKQFRLNEGAILERPRFRIETQKGNYEISIYGKSNHIDTTSVQRILTTIDGKRIDNNEYYLSIEVFEQLVKKNFKELPYMTKIKLESSFSGEEVEFEDYETFYAKAKKEGVKSIMHLWILENENDNAYNLNFGDNKISFLIRGLPLIYY
ncbi:hypothetical protein [Marinilabilia sp.]|uniref:hypothetical protein n=1 Tax=Marinilabilia sp. TaxID=2021252 RepID=UPI0025BC3F5F|nr:hypothetical protein [Marinilabilia sp.]